MQYTLSDKASPVELITLARAKEHLRILHTEQDGLIEDYITAARHWAEGYIRRALAAKDVSVYLSKAIQDNQLKIVLPIATDYETSYTVEVYGELIDPSLYRTLPGPLPTIVIPETAISAYLPDDRTDYDITVDYTPTVYGSRSDIKLSLLQIIGNFFYHADGTPLEDQKRITNLLQQHRVRDYM